MKYAFIGTGAFAASCLERLCEWAVPEWIATSRSRPSGRGGRLTRTPVALLAQRLSSLSGVSVIETERASGDEAVLAARRDSGVDFIFVTDFGQMIREPLLGGDGGAFCLNIHPSLLPLYRGAAPVQRAIMACEEVSGVTVFKLDSGMDSGPVLLCRSFDLDGLDTGAALAEAARAGVDAFVELARSKPVSEWTFTPQDDARATHAAKISREEERIVWSAPARSVVGRIRALSPKPGAWTDMCGTRLKVIAADVSDRTSSDPAGRLRLDGEAPTVATSDLDLVLRIVQAEGKKAVSAVEWRNGLRGAAEVSFV